MPLTPDHLFRLFGDPTRLRCLLLLRREGWLCVCELTEALGIIQPKISRHLAMLREAGLVECRRRGQWVHYRISPEQPPWVAPILDAAVQASDALAWHQEDRERLERMANRVTTKDQA
ncbi:MAG: metalloregulator ArsR/SmtB family transcription factor [Halorhodospira halophila]|uniref:metalloregulator ArsR/SmtB family transcription factor n=1 Tax=Halorhodospira TaxID=85108 RepID=UPI001911DFA8|nr:MULTISPECIES: metalloregulator ArsR/SmtB family transcription factor [Halorhodospira]MBK5935746.1 ArsR family transcriptional regulator [Halorhodospira halophila]MBK5943490.1 ArsR family transcriptional regulator [Halorhodospira halophila]MCC3750206.1 metalloregulator ArsR/SmtB family transcription factor [Halorhodospira halophila]MCG5527020.1 metalloregulator ArsR/SmtB family transcription factor [Halorhodospira halophila]MCG5532351.1 metalloregulator ArsR/SmtB family transcription factor 